MAYGLAVILMTSVMGQGQSEAQRVVQMISFENGFHIVNGILLGAFLLAIVLSIGLMFFFSRKRSTEGLFSFDKIYLVTFLAMILRSLISGYGLWLYMGKTVPLIFYWLPALCNTDVLSANRQLCHYRFRLHPETIYA